MTATWTGSPRTWSSGDQIDADTANQEWRDRLDWLKRFADDEATSSEATTGTDSAAWMSSRRVREAIDGRVTAVGRGAALATRSEAQTGTNNTKLMTPLLVADAVSAHETNTWRAEASDADLADATNEETVTGRRFVGRKASKDQAEAGTDNGHWMTPQRTKEAIDVLGGGGYALKRERYGFRSNETWGDGRSAPSTSTTMTLASSDANNHRFFVRVVLDATAGSETVPLAFWGRSGGLRTLWIQENPVDTAVGAAQPVAFVPASGVPFFIPSGTAFTATLLRSTKPAPTSSPSGTGDWNAWPHGASSTFTRNFSVWTTMFRLADIVKLT